MRFFVFGFAIAVSVAISGCKKQGAGGPPGGMPPPQVVVVSATMDRIVEKLSVVANLQANEMVELKAESDGIVSQILFEEGQQVEAGQLLVVLDDTKFAATSSQSEANFKLAESSFLRAKQLFEEKLVAQQEFDQAAATFQANQANLEFSRRQLRDARITAPFEGVMSARYISPGQVISRNQVITAVIDPDPIKVEFQIPEKFLGQLALKQKIEAGVAAYPGQKFSGEVFFISPFVDPTNRTALVKARIPNKEMLLRPGMFANMDLILTVRESSVVIPETAITQILDQNKAQLFVVDETSTAQLRTIETGVRQAGTVEVVSGLKVGEKIMVEGLQKVAPGIKVRVAGAPVAPTPKNSEAAKAAK